MEFGIYSNNYQFTQKSSIKIEQWIDAIKTSIKRNLKKRYHAMFTCNEVILNENVLIQSYTKKALITDELYGNDGGYSKRNIQIRNNRMKMMNNHRIITLNLWDSRHFELIERRPPLPKFIWEEKKRRKVGNKSERKTTKTIKRERRKRNEAKWSK